MLDAVFNAASLRYEIKCILQELRHGFDEDCSVALLDSKGNLLEADLKHGIDLTSFDTIIKNTTKYIIPTKEECLLTNDPYSGSPRLSDLYFAKPIFVKSDLRYYLTLRISIPQLLSKNTPKLFSTIDEEGIRIPPTALDSRGQVKKAILDFLSSIGDRKEFETVFDRVESRLATSTLLLSGLPISEHYGPVIEYADKLIHQMLSNLPDGEYSAQEYLDDDGIEKQQVKIQTKITIHDKNVLINFAGTNKQSKGPYNCTYPMTMAACLWPFLSLIEAPLPLNSALFKFLAIEAPEGTLVNAKAPAAVFGGSIETAQRISDCVQLALSKALPQTTPALSGGSCNVTLLRFENGRFWFDAMAGGLGASSKGDGLSGLHTGFLNFTQASVEEMEMQFPIRVVHHNLRSGSGGHGRFNGGHGLARGIQLLSPARAWLLSDRRSLKAHGLVGGTSGSPGETITVSRNKRDKGPPFKRVVDLEAGDLLINDSPGGGGWGKLKESAEDDDA